MSKANKSSARVVGAHTRETEIGGISRFTTLGDGFCYIADPRNGKSYHVKINSERFWEILDELDGKVTKESLRQHAQREADKNPTHEIWPVVLEKLAV